MNQYWNDISNPQKRKMASGAFASYLENMYICVHKEKKLGQTIFFYYTHAGMRGCPPKWQKVIVGLWKKGEAVANAYFFKHYSLKAAATDQVRIHGVTGEVL